MADTPTPNSENDEDLPGARASSPTEVSPKDVSSPPRDSGGDDATEDTKNQFVELFGTDSSEDEDGQEQNNMEDLPESGTFEPATDRDPELRKLELAKAEKEQIRAQRRADYRRSRKAYESRRGTREDDYLEEDIRPIYRGRNDSYEDGGDFVRRREAHRRRRTVTGAREEFDYNVTSTPEKDVEEEEEMEEEEEIEEEAEEEEAEAGAEIEAATEEEAELDGVEVEDDTEMERGKSLVENVAEEEGLDDEDEDEEDLVVIKRPKKRARIFAGDEK
ncbi:8448_t:CDS:2 [Paraglomus brasilianum]|uniref:8448_t:CDS:1 n=1 Tax=Paraglomus brasilianum TaxID=144538 RepID=A0A9N9BRG2_9GLOM|nr:8448_t:CDS:2 [Paraglomus brasilianum]